jgi:hypothetical protein
MANAHNEPVHDRVKIHRIIFLFGFNFRLFRVSIFRFVFFFGGSEPFEPLSAVSPKIQKSYPPPKKHPCKPVRPIGVAPGNRPSSPPLPPNAVARSPGIGKVRPQPGKTIPETMRQKPNMPRARRHTGAGYFTRPW